MSELLAELQQRLQQLHAPPHLRFLSLERDLLLSRLCAADCNSTCSGQ
jgi:hypothetical protein